MREEKGRRQRARGAGASDAVDKVQRQGSRGDGAPDGGDTGAMEGARCGGPSGRVESSRGGGHGAMEEAVVVGLAAMEKTTTSSSGKKRRRPLTRYESGRRDSAWMKREWIRREQETAEFMKMYPDYVPIISDSDDQLSWDSDETWVDEESVLDSGATICPLCNQTIKPSKDGTERKLAVHQEGGGGELAVHQEGGGGKLDVQEDGWVTVRKIPARRIGN